MTLICHQWLIEWCNSQFTCHPTLAPTHTCLPADVPSSFCCVSLLPNLQDAKATLHALTALALHQQQHLLDPSAFGLPSCSPISVLLSVRGLLMLTHHHLILRNSPYQWDERTVSCYHKYPDCLLLNGRLGPRLQP